MIMSKAVMRVVAGCALIAFSGSIVGCNTVPLAKCDEKARDANYRAIIAEYQATKKPSGEQHLVAAVAYISQGDVDHAKKSAEASVDWLNAPKKKAAAYGILAQCALLKGDLANAGQLALEGARLDRDSLPLAAMRYAIANKANNQLEMLAAEKALCTIDPGYKAKPVSLGGVLLGVMIVTALCKLWIQIDPYMTVIPSDARIKITNTAEAILHCGEIVGPYLPRGGKA